ncbi:hypothetical protein HDV05_000325, partial [Chytridiales sp. JEL 0842]
NSFGAKHSNTAQSKKVRAQVSNLVDRIIAKGHVVLTTYEGLRVHHAKLIPISWAYCVLDEGHKIRNADAAVTLTCKQIKTPHRIILSGTPIQNNLKELWSLFDFVFPGRLGTLPVFLTQFEVPIRIGAYSNASNLQVQTAHRCAAVLRDLISPYLLRRMKTDVASDLPKKTEQVLFCRLTKEQRKLYEKFIEGPEVRGILDGRRNALAGIDGVRKICNHPDLMLREELQNRPDYGSIEKSGKMQVLKALLDMWKRQTHRALVFCQTRQMCDILEKFLQSESYVYRRMDGNTPIRNRIAMVDEFNKKDTIKVFLLTTKVGGLGINLTGANRVVIFDPDWNPSTDVQARERAWRLGQTKDVVVYRLMMAGTIEEKIYHRQIYKQFLTNKILHDPSSGGVGKSKRYFDSNSLHDLFVLADEREVGTETGNMFRGSEKLGAAAEAQRRAEEEERKKRKKGKGKEKAIVPEDQLEEINGLAKVEDFKMKDDPGFADDGESAAKAEGDDGDDRILSALVHSTVAHDHIMGDKTTSKETLELIAKQAAKVAEEAKEQLRKSRHQVKIEQKKAMKASGGDYVGVVTWTGSHGTGGARAGGSSSSSSVNAVVGSSSHEGQPRRFGTSSSVPFGSPSASASVGGSSRFGNSNSESNSNSNSTNPSQRRFGSVPEGG